VLGSVLWAGGCGGDQPEKPFDARMLSGQGGHACCSPILNSVRNAPRRSRNCVQEGRAGDKAALGIFAPDIDYREAFADFFAGHKRLVRWEFLGKPERDNVAVSLFFDDLDSGPVNLDKLVQVDRCLTWSSCRGPSLASRFWLSNRQQTRRKRRRRRLALRRQLQPRPR
jgi:hypothetical protein